MHSHGMKIVLTTSLVAVLILVVMEDALAHAEVVASQYGNSVS